MGTQFGRNKDVNTLQSLIPGLGTDQYSGAEPSTRSHPSQAFRIGPPTTIPKLFGQPLADLH